MWLYSMEISGHQDKCENLESVRHESSTTRKEKESNSKKRQKKKTLESDDIFLRNRMILKIDKSRAENWRKDDEDDMF